MLKAKSGPVPMYQKIKLSILEKIESGEWAPDQKLPSEAELTVAFDVSRMTVHHALRDLQSQGYLTRVQGLGTFVAPPSAHHTVVDIRNVADVVRGRGGRYTAKLLGSGSRKITASEADVFNLSRRRNIFFANILHSENDAPLQLETRVVNPDVVPKFLTEGLKDTDAFSYLMKLYPYPDGKHIIRARGATAAEGKVLGLKKGEPCLEMERITYFEEATVTHATFLYPADRFEIEGEITSDTRH